MKAWKTLNVSYLKLITISDCLNHCSMTKYIPNQHRYLDNTYSILYSLKNKYDKTCVCIGKIDNTDCLIKSLFNDKLYP